MSAPQVRERDVEALFTDGGLVVSGAYVWQQSSSKAWIRMDLPVTGKKGTNLKIVITVNRFDPSLYSFALLLNNAFRVRGLDVNGSHRNKHTNREKWVGQTHKHKWTDQCGDRFAYTPSDITAQDLQGQLAQFCSECGISYAATIAPFPLLQEELFNDL